MVTNANKCAQILTNALTYADVCVCLSLHPLGWAHSLWRFLGPQLGLLFLVAQQLNTYFCVFVCVFSVFDMKCLSL